MRGCGQVHVRPGERAVSFFSLQDIPPGVNASIDWLVVEKGTCRWCGTQDGSRRTWCRKWSFWPGRSTEHLTESTLAGLVGNKTYGYWWLPCALDAYHWWHSASAIRRARFKFDGFRCLKCGVAPTVVVAGRTVPDLSAFHLDHVHPIVAGGKTTWANLQTLCAAHNLAKAGKIVLANVLEGVDAVNRL